MGVTVFGNKLSWAEQAAFLYRELSRENISSAMKECTGFAGAERAQNSLFMAGCTVYMPHFYHVSFIKICLHEYHILKLVSVDKSVRHSSCVVFAL